MAGVEQDHADFAGEQIPGRLGQFVGKHQSPGAGWQACRSADDAVEVPLIGDAESRHRRLGEQRVGPDYRVIGVEDAAGVLVWLGQAHWSNSTFAANGRCRAASPA
jgi:hypothetical protein